MTGGTGFVGKNLVNGFLEKDHEVTVLTRHKVSDRPGIEGLSFVEGDPAEEGDWQESIADYDAIINLAGASIFRRWTKSIKETIRDSRIETTRNIVDAFSAGKGSDAVLLNASAVGYYGFHEEEALDESGSPGEDFLASISQEWEAAAREAENLGVRVVLMRFGIVMGRGGGALKQMLPLFRNCLGSPLGSGRQWFSWIHEQDLINICLYLLEHRDISGPVNCTAPDPVRNKDMTKILGDVLKKPTFMPAVPGFVLKMMMGEFGSVLLEGQKVLPKRLLKAGFRFDFPDLRGTLEDLLINGE